MVKKVIKKTIYTAPKSKKKRKTSKHSLATKIARPSFLVLFSLVYLVFSFYLYFSLVINYNKTNSPQAVFNSEYTTALSSKNFAALWNLFAPSYQQEIQKKVSKQMYITFLQKKFTDVQIKHISLSSCKKGQTTFPYGVERNYPQTCLMNLSLILSSPNASIAAQLQMLSQTKIAIVSSRGKDLIVGGGPTGLQAPVLFPSKIPSTTASVPILMYHRIAPLPRRSEFNTDYGYLLDVGLTTTTTNFSAQMNRLQKLGYHPISPNDLFNHLYYNLPLPSKPVLLTFDDGRLSDFTNGLPILLKHHFTATYFIPPALSGKVVGLDGHNKYMNFAQLKTLTTDGMFVENHSLYHTKPLWNLPPNTLQTQLTQANHDLLTYTHYPIQFIAYDGAWPSQNWRQTTPAIEQTMSVLSHMGFVFAVEDTGNNVIIENSQLPYQIPRVRPQNKPDIASLLTSS